MNRDIIAPFLPMYVKSLALDKLAEESSIVLAGENEEVFEELLRLNGSSSGARP